MALVRSVVGWASSSDASPEALPATPPNSPPVVENEIFKVILYLPSHDRLLPAYHFFKMATPDNNDHLIRSTDSKHPANLIPQLCRKFWQLGWVSGTGGGTSIRDNDLVYLAPSGVSKELMEPENLFVLEMSKQLDPKKRIYLREPPNLKPSQCTPLFMAAFKKRDAGCCIHTHSQWAVLITLLLESKGPPNHKVFEINNIEQIKAFGKGFQKKGNLGYHDTLRIPIIENTPFEEDLTETLEQAIEEYPDTYAILVRRHGLYVWGETVDRAKAQAESLDYLFQLAVEMHKLGLPWLSHIA